MFSIIFTVSCISSVLFAANMSSWKSSGFSLVSPIFQLCPCVSMILVSESIVRALITVEEMRVRVLAFPLHPA